MGGSSKSKSSSNTAQTDNRVVNSSGTVIGAGAVVNNAGADQIAALNAQLLNALNTSTTDTVKFIAGLGAQGIKDMGAAAGDIYARAGSNTTNSLNGVVGTSERLIGKLIDATTAQSAANQATVSAVVGSYAPPDAKGQDASTKRLGYIAAAVVAGALLLRK